jgi:2-polyprenyl-3-methyl-5-hydroxy-6-metoxy-1,4-benzoquinol methylase
MKKILVVIANYGIKNDGYARRVIQEYASLPHNVRIVVLTNTPKTFEGPVEVVLHQPTSDPWSFPFAHKQILADRLEDYDLFIYSEDDTLITDRNIAAFLQSVDTLKEDEIAGFIRVERTAEGERSFSTINSHFHWDPASVVRRGGDLFALFTNEHAACYILTREQLRRAIRSGGFLVGPHQEKYDLLVTAATDPYTQCGFRKLVCITRLEDFVIEHLPNKYIGQFGISVEDLNCQVTALQEIAAGTRPPSVLLSTETKLRHLRWSKNFYEPVREEIVAALPKGVKTLLSFGCGLGELEAEMQKRGIRVTAVALDSVIGKCAEARGLEVIYGDTTEALNLLSGRRFDAVLVLNLLHLVPQPEQLLARLTTLVTATAVIVATTPNMAHLGVLWKRVKGAPSVEGLGSSYGRIGMHVSSPWKLKRWFQASGLKVDAVTSTVATGTPWWARLFQHWLARDLLVRGVRCAA